MPSSLKKLPPKLRKPIEQKTTRSEVYNDFFFNSSEKLAAWKTEALDEYRRRWELLCEHYGADPKAEWPPSKLTKGLMRDFVPGTQFQQASRPRWILLHDMALWYHSENAIAQGRTREYGYKELVTEEKLKELLPYPGVNIATLRQRRSNLAKLPKILPEQLVKSKAFVEEFEAACIQNHMDPVEIGYSLFVAYSPLLGVTILDEDGNLETWPNLFQIEREREATS